MADDVPAPLATATAAVTEAAKQFNLTEGKCYGGEELGIDVLGLVAIIVFYLAVLGVRKFVQIHSTVAISHLLLYWDLTTGPPIHRGVCAVACGFYRNSTMQCRH